MGSSEKNFDGIMYMHFIIYIKFVYKIFYAGCGH